MPRPKLAAVLEKWQPPEIRESQREELAHKLEHRSDLGGMFAVDAMPSPECKSYPPPPRRKSPTPPPVADPSPKKVKVKKERKEI